MYHMKVRLKLFNCFKLQLIWTSGSDIINKKNPVLIVFFLYLSGKGNFFKCRVSKFIKKINLHKVLRKMDKNSDKKSDKSDTVR